MNRVFQTMKQKSSTPDPGTTIPTGGLTIQDAFQLLSVRVHAQFCPKTEAPKRPRPTFNIAETSKCS